MDSDETALGEKMTPAAVLKVVTPHGNKEREVMPVSEDGEVTTAVGKKEEPEMVTIVEEIVGWHEHAVVLQFDLQHSVQLWIPVLSSPSLPLTGGQELDYEAMSILIITENINIRIPP